MTATAHQPGDFGTIIGSIGPASRHDLDDKLHITYMVRFDDTPDACPALLADVRIREVCRWTSPIVWMLYDHPRDYPNNFAARMLNHDEPTKEVILFDSLEEARRSLRHLGLACVGRHPDDDPEMVEVWL